MTRLLRPLILAAVAVTLVAVALLMVFSQKAPAVPVRPAELAPATTVLLTPATQVDGQPLLCTTDSRTCIQAEALTITRPVLPGEVVPS